MKNKFSNRLKNVPFSATMEATHLAQQRINKGLKTIDLGIGGADFNVPNSATKKLITIAKKGKAHYTEPQGIKQLRESISKAVKNCYYDEQNRRTFSLNYSANEIIVSPGSKKFIFWTPLILCNATKQEEVLIHAPYWPPYYDTALIAGAIPKIINTTEENKFELKADVLEENISNKTKLFIFNSPNNPTGNVVSKKNLKKIANVLLDKNVFVLSDEIYTMHTFNKNKHYSIASIVPEIQEQCIVSNGISKSYSMAGWRLGYALIKNKQIYNAFIIMASNTISSASSPIQEATIELFENAVENAKKIRKTMQKRSELAYKRLNELFPETFKPKGSFYIFPKVSEFYGKKINGKKIKNSKDFSKALLNEGVSTVWGSAFGKDENIRFSLVRKTKELEKAFDIVEQFVNKLK